MSEFEADTTFAPEEFTAEPVEVVKPPSGEEINNTAIVSLNSADPVGNFLNISQERAIVSKSPSFDTLRQGQIEGMQDAAAAELYSVLGNEETSIEHKAKVVELLKEASNHLFEPRVIAGTAMASKVSNGETMASEEQTINWTKSIGEWNEFAGWKQQTLNHEVAKSSNEGFFDFMTDTLGQIIPLVDPAVRLMVANSMVDEGLMSEEDVSVWGTTSDIKKATTVGSIEQRKETLRKVLKIIDEETTGPLGLTQNEVIQVDLLRSIFEDEYHTDNVQLLQDGVFVLDVMSIVYPPLKLARAKAGSAIGRSSMRAAIRDARMAYVSGRRSPVSSAEVAHATHTDTAKAINETLAESGDEAARALTGTDQAGALIDDLMPDPISAGNTLRRNTQGASSVVDEVEEVMNNTGRSFIDDDVRDAARTKVIEKVEKGSTDSVSFRSGSSQFGELDETGRFKYRAVYGATDDAGFTTAEQAISETKYAHRADAIEEGDIRLYGRDITGEYIPILKNEAELYDDILTSVDVTYEVSAKDVKTFMKADMPLLKASLLDKLVPGFKGKASGYAKVFDSTFEKIVSLPVLAQGEKATLIGDILKNKASLFIKQLGKLSEARITRVDTYLRRANLDGIAFDRRALRNEGWSNAELDAVSTFRQLNDDMWVLDNMAEVAGLRAESFGLVSPGDGSSFIGKQVGDEGMALDSVIYNPKTGEMMTLQDFRHEAALFEDMKLYQMPARINSGDFSFTHVLTEDKNWRALKNSDKVKGYREGYYNVDYVDANFVIKRVKTANGFRDSAVATSADSVSATREAARLTASATDSNITYFARKDLKNRTNLKREVDMEHGRYAIKFRGERLNSGNGVSDEGLRAATTDPLSATVKQADNLARRLGNDDLMRTLESRFLKAFGTEGKDGTGSVLIQGQFPTSVDDISSSVIGMEQKVADAKVMFNWMEAQRRSATGFVDAGVQGALNSLAESMSRRGIKGAGVVQGLAKAEPVMFTKGKIFELYVALNPPRQIALAALDTLKTAAIGTKYTLSGKMYRDYNAMRMVTKGYPAQAAKLSGRSEREIIQMTNEYRLSGLSSGIDEQRAVTSGVGKVAKEQTLVDAAKGLNKYQRFVKFNSKWGFELGERIQNGAAWLSFREKKVKEMGRFDLTLGELDDIAGASRHFAYSQTKAAAPTYNDSLSIVAQFAAIGHKGISLTLPQALGGSKVLSGAEKLKLNAFFTATYGAPIAAITDILASTIENEWVRGFVRDGLLWLSMYALTGASISADGMNPADIQGFIERVALIATGEWSKASPTTGAFSKMNNMSNVFMGLYGPQQIEGVETSQKMLGLAKAFSEFYPAASNTFKAGFMVALQRNASKNNYTIDEEVSIAEAIMAIGGFKTTDERDRFIISNTGRESFTDLENDVKGHVDMARRAAAATGMKNDDLATRLAVSEAFWMVYKNNPKALAMANKELNKLLGSDNNYYKRMIDMIGIVPADTLKGMVNISELNEEKKELIINAIDQNATAFEEQR